MSPPEPILWSAMLGGMATLAAFARADAIIRRSIASVRAFVFVASTGAACIVLTGLAPVVFAGMPLQTLHTLLNSLGLFSSAWALSYLGLWPGVAGEDRIVRNIVRWGAWAEFIAGCTLALLTLAQPAQNWRRLLAVTAALNSLAVLNTGVATLRAIALGDRMAWGILAATDSTVGWSAWQAWHKVTIPLLVYPKALYCLPRWTTRFCAAPAAAMNAR